MAETSLAVKYRPKTFEDVTEQGSTKTILTQQLASGAVKNAYLFCGGAGTGKAQPLYSKVLTPDGYISMGNVSLGTQVITRKGDTASVTGVYPQGVRPIYEITLQDRTKIRVADNHLNSVYRYNQCTKMREDFVLTTTELIDFIKTSKYRVRIDTPSVDFLEQEVLIPPYLLGALIGDGSLHNNFAFSNSEQDIIFAVNVLLNEQYSMHLQHRGGYDYAIRYNDNPKHNGSRGDKGEHELVRNYDVLTTLRGQLEHYGLLCTSLDKHIPKEYLINTKQVRLRLLQGLFDTDGYIGKGGEPSFSTSSKQLSEDFAFLVRSLGIRDTISEKVPTFTYRGEVIVGHVAYTHHLHVPNGLKFFASRKHSERYRDRQHPPLRNIVSIEYVGDEECQCIMVDNEDHTYISDDFIPTHNTTCARIFANEINKGQGEPTELDAASNNSVDDVRLIIQQSKTQSLDSEYRIFIIDECVTGDVEILTDKGFKRFDECDGTEVVAQYNKGKVEFVKPDSWIKQQYTGDLIKWSPRNWCSVRMTPNHVQPLYYSASKEVKESYIKDIKFAQSNNLIVSGHGTGSKHELSPMDRLAIACQADATIQSFNNGYTHWSIQLTKERKISRLLKIFEDGSIPYTEIKGRTNTRRFTFDTPTTVTKCLSTHFNLDVDFVYARKFIEEVVAWDGYSTDKYVEYMSVNRVNADFVASIAVLGGYSVRQRIQSDNRQPNYKPVHKVFLYDKQYVNCAYIKKTVVHEPYDGLVYCVKVPSHQIVIRSQGFVFITGNCHALSNNAWQAFLKLLEEPPKKSIFIFCTTDPQKIPKTILSRVQRFDFQRISQQGIMYRLADIIVSEKVPHADNDAVAYIAKLADGGMRDAITMLDKCLAYSTELTVENVLKALGAVNYGTFFDLTDAITADNTANVVSIVERVYSEGKDLKQFVKDYLSFLLDINKYDILHSFDYLKLPTTYQEELGKRDVDFFRVSQGLLPTVVKLSSDLKWETQPKTLIEAVLLGFIWERHSK